MADESNARASVTFAFRAASRAVAGLAVVLSSFATTATASAEVCPDVQVVFARGTFEPAGVGLTGQAFVDDLQGQLPGKSVAVYPVNYPASLDFSRAADGVADASTEVQDIAASCPRTRVVIGGYSQGAAVAAYLTADEVPADYVLPTGITGPITDSVASHVAAVALFGKPTGGVLNLLDPNAPPLVIGHLYSAKVLELCVPEDPVCAIGGADRAAHSAYAGNGMTRQAAEFAVQRILSA